MITGKPVVLKTAVAKATAKKPVVKKPVKVGPPSLTDWLSGDGTYQDTLTDTNAALSNSLGDITRQKTDYDTTYNNDLRDLGFNKATGWNMADALTQSGKAFSGQAADFAARGMLQSTGYGDATTNLTRQLNDQLSTASQARQKYDSDLDQYGASQNQDALDALTQAKRQAIARYAAKYATSANAALS